MANYLGTLSWGIVPRNVDGTNLATMSWDYRDNYLKSANDQLRYQVQWFNSCYLSCPELQCRFLVRYTLIAILGTAAYKRMGFQLDKSCKVVQHK